MVSRIGIEAARRRHQAASLATLLVFTALFTTAALAKDPPPPRKPAWKTAWALDTGFRLDLDTEGYLFPTAIAFVPQPGPNPKDPLYFVTELRGTVKVVTNDRTVTTFAEGFLRTSFHDESPDGSAEFGLAGICLDPAHGYVFVTFAYQAEDRSLRNNIIRFRSTPGAFSVAPTDRTEFAEIFQPFKSGVSHQIGPCQVDGDRLYVSVGDGFDTPMGSQQVDKLLGKILRMTLDGEPAPENPFFDPGARDKAAGYVWAYGLRNPFSLKRVGGKLCAFDNGLSTDRFLEVRRGENYQWDGTERSMAINVPCVIVPSVGPVQADYLPNDSKLFPESLRGRFYVALSGKVPGIMMFHYDLDKGRMLEAPRYFMQHRESGRQLVTGLAFGPDGLYFAPILPDADGRTAVYKVSFDESVTTPGTLLENPNPWVLLYEKGCYGCHRLGDLIRGGDIGPPLDREPLVERLQRMLESEDYLRSLDEMDGLVAEPQSSWRRARDEVRRATGLERVRTWVKYRVREPRFDRVLSAMPNMGISDAESQWIAKFLVDGLEGPTSPPGPLVRIAQLLPDKPGRRHIVYAFAMGGLLGVGGGLGVISLRRRVVRN